MPLDDRSRRDRDRLRRRAIFGKADPPKAADNWQKSAWPIDKAKSFHAQLKLDKHTATHVVRSTGLKTVTQVSFSLNDQGELECPLLRAETGDGTVPLTSQDALLDVGAKEAGPTITGGVHSAICTHPQAMRQVTDLLRGALVTALRTQPQTRRA